MVGNTFRLKSDTMAILCEDDYRSVISIPAGGQLLLIGGDIERDRFMKIRYQGKVLIILSEDLRRGLGLESDTSTS